jgi:hypothetical protein
MTACLPPTLPPAGALEAIATVISKTKVAASFTARCLLTSCMANTTSALSLKSVTLILRQSRAGGELSPRHHRLIGRWVELQNWNLANQPITS